MRNGLNFIWKKESRIRSWEKFNTTEFREKFDILSSRLSGIGRNYFEEEVRLCTDSRNPIFSVMVTGSGQGFATWNKFEVSPCIRSLVTDFEEESERVCKAFESQFEGFKERCRARDITV
jgi:hypothetical protein